MDFQREHLIFRPGEEFTFTIKPRGIVVNATGTAACRVVLTNARADTELWSAEKEIAVVAGRDVNPIGPFTVSLPRQEGAYDLVLLFQRTTSLNPLSAPTWTFGRRVGVVIVGLEKPSATTAKNAAAATEEWKLVQQVDLSAPAKPATERSLGWMESLVGRAGDMPLLGLKPAGGAATDKTAQSPNASLTPTELPPQTLKAAALTITEPHRPHFVEIDFPTDQPQALAVAVLEAGQPSAAGLAVDRGCVWEAGDCTPGGTHTHRLVFWPTTPTPWLVIANPHDTTARCGAIRIRAGAERLAAIAPAPNLQDRLTAVYIENPALLLDTFSGSVKFDKNLTPAADWTAWQQAGDRLTQYLLHVGYNGVSVPIVHAGGTLYPSRHVLSFVDSERGLAATEPGDPRVKDIAELLLRQLERQQLRCVPALQLSCNVRALDALAQSEEGIILMPPPNAVADAGPKYNLLHPQVQVAFRQLVAEVVARYGKREAFAGLVIPLLPDTCTHLPGVEWGADEATLTRFLAEQQVERPVTLASQPAGELFRQRPELRERWIAWRCQAIAQFYRSLAEEFDKLPPSARLYVCGPDLPATTSSSRSALRELGIDPELLASSPRLVWSLPQRMNVNETVRDPRDSIAAVALPTQPTSSLPRATAAFVLRAQRDSSFPLTDALRSAGMTAESLRLVGQSTAGNARVREALLRELSAADPLVLFDGGPLPPLGQERGVRDIVQAVRLLPVQTFRDVPPENAAEGSLIAVRALHDGDASYATLVNPSRWPCRATLYFDPVDELKLECLSDGAISQPRREGLQTIWTVELRPRDFVAISGRGEQALARSYRVEIDPSVREKLQAELTAVKERAEHKRLRRFANPSFEEPTAHDDDIPGWQSQGQAQGRVELTIPGRTGRKALRLASDKSGAGVQVGIVGGPIAVQQSQRFAAGVWMRTPRPDDKPSVRLTLEIITPSGLYVQARDVGGNATAGSTAPPLGGDWSWYDVSLHALPPEATEVVFRVTLRTAGEVYVDDAAGCDHWLTPLEQQSLTAAVAEGETLLAQNKIIAAERLLRSDRFAWVERREVQATPVATALQRSPAAPKPVVLSETTTRRSQQFESTRRPLRQSPRRPFEYAADPAILPSDTVERLPPAVEE